MSGLKILSSACTLIALVGCHSSFTHLDGGSDSATDTGHDTIVDPVPDSPGDTIVDTTPPPPSGYALHEWGVMVMGSDGGTFHGSGPEYGGPIPAKPVIYLYADEAFDLDLAIRFASGTPTETWPEAPLDPALLWSGLRVEPGPCTATPFPSPWEDEGYCEACTLGLTVVEDAACVTYGGQVATLLFYTGTLPSYESPLEVDATLMTGVDGSSQLSIGASTTGTQAVEGIWVVYRQTTDACIDPSACGVAAADIAWQYIDRVAPGEALGFSVPVQHFEAELDESGWPIPGTLVLPAAWEDLGGDLEAALMARGLSDGETAAFLNAWDTIFFGLMGSDSLYLEPLYSNGAAAISFMGRADYDANLRLETSAPAEEVVRVGMVYEPVLVEVAP